MKSRVFCHRNCCVSFALCDGTLAGIQSHCPDNVDDIQAVRKSSTDQCNSSGQLFSADNEKDSSFFYSKKLRRSPSALSRNGILSGIQPLW